MTDAADRLSSYPYVVVRVACDRCGRRGAYRLARLAARHGAEMGMRELLHHWTFDCAWKQDTRYRQARNDWDTCDAYFPDIQAPAPPPDLPPSSGGLHVIEGGGAGKPPDRARKKRAAVSSK